MKYLNEWIHERQMRIEKKDDGKKDYRIVFIFGIYANA